MKEVNIPTNHFIAAVKGLFLTIYEERDIDK
jgi:hypothetical protein